MKIKLSNTEHVLACLVHAISAIAANPPDTLAATIISMNHLDILWRETNFNIFTYIKVCTQKVSLTLVNYCVIYNY
jgi:hypothetical protein